MLPTSASDGKRNHNSDQVGLFIDGGLVQERAAIAARAERGALSDLKTEGGRDRISSPNFLIPITTFGDDKEWKR